MLKGPVWWRAAVSAVVGGTVAGAFDALVGAPVLFKTTPMVILHVIAAGALGRDVAMHGGMKTAIIGMVWQLIISIGAAAVYVIASLFAPILRRRPIIGGLVFGAGVCFVMQYVVVPLSLAAHKGPAPSPLMYALNLLDQMILFGVPIALINVWALGRAAKPATCQLNDPASAAG